MISTQSPRVLSPDEEHAARVKYAVRFLFGGFLPVAIFGIGFGIVIAWCIPPAELKANPDLRFLAPAVAVFFILLGLLFPLLGWLRGPDWTVGAAKAQEKKALSAGFGLCGTCGSTLAVRVDGDSITSTGSAVTGGRWEWRFSRTCPKCSGALCCFDKCTAKAELALAHAFGVGDGRGRVSIRDDAVLCPAHFSLLQRWYSVVGWQRQVSIFIVSISALAAVGGFVAGFPAIGIGAVVVLALTLAIEAIVERHLSRRLFGKTPKRKPESTIRVRGSLGSVWDNGSF